MANIYKSGCSVKENTTTLADKEFPFFEPKLRISDWDTDILTEDDSTILLDTADFKNKRLSVLERDPKVPILFFTGQLYQELRFMTDLHPNCEWGVFLTLKRVSNLMPHFLAFDWFMPGQEASGGAVNMQAKSATRYYDYLKSNYEYYQKNGLHKHLCHLHSHHSLNMANFSSIDDAQQFGRDDLGFMDDYRMYIVVTLNSGIKASMVVYKPVLTRVNLAIGVTYANPEYVGSLTKKRKDEIAGIMKQCVSSRTLVRDTSAITDKTPSVSSLWPNTWNNNNNLYYYHTWSETKKDAAEANEKTKHCSLKKTDKSKHKGKVASGTTHKYSQHDFEAVMGLMSVVCSGLLPDDYDPASRKIRDVIHEAHQFEDYLDVQVEGDGVLLRNVADIVEMCSVTGADMDAVLQVILELCVVYHAVRFNTPGVELYNTNYLSRAYIDEIFALGDEGSVDPISNELIEITIEELADILGLRD